MFKYFANCHTLDAASERMRDYTKRYHPDSATGNAEIFRDISREYQEIRIVITHRDHFKQVDNAPQRPAERIVHVPVYVPVQNITPAPQKGFTIDDVMGAIAIGGKVLDAVVKFGEALDFDDDDDTRSVDETAEEDTPAPKKSRMRRTGT